MFLPGTLRMFRAGFQLRMHCNGYVANGIRQMCLKDGYLMLHRHDLVLHAIDLRRQLHLQAYHIAIGSCAFCWGVTATATQGPCHFPWWCCVAFATIGLQCCMTLCQGVRPIFAD